MEAEDLFYLSDGRRVFTVGAPFEMDREKPEIVNQHAWIKHDNQVHVGRVVAVERFCLARTVPIRIGESIGLVLAAESAR